MANTIAIFTGVTINGQDFSDVENVRAFAQAWSAQADRTWDDELYWIASSLFDLLDEVEGVTAALEEWLADPSNVDDEEYSDIYKDVYGFRPRY